MFNIRSILEKVGVDCLRSSNRFKIGQSHTFIRKHHEYRNIGVLDTSIGSRNLGDFIIMESVYKHINNMFDKAYFTTFPTHLHIVGDDRNFILDKELLFVGGTNLINCDNISLQWKIRENDLKYYSKRCVLMGVGASAYKDEPSSLTKRFLREVLSEEHMHSVRDEYTKGMLNKMGIYNVINTCCPTTWNLPQRIGGKILKKDWVVTTITDYNQDYKRDSEMLKILLKNYEKVCLWVQGTGDLDYLKRLVDLKDEERIYLIPPSIEAYRSFLNENNDSIDYIGTRLHAGIFAIQRDIRSLIIGIDNRAREIGKDINLNVIDRVDIQDISDFIMNPVDVKLSLPVMEIEEWKKQFRD